MAKKSNEEVSLMEAVSKELKGKFDLNKFKEKKLLSGNVKFKEQKWIPFSKAMQDALSSPGIAMGHINIVRGGSNTGKTTWFEVTVPINHSHQFIKIVNITIKIVFLCFFSSYFFIK